ncbi:MAG: MFS transporter [Candidatus Schekmanbacteria bacterium]|nr:MAG: MFS transporter [Candidatus Schekmanbacteria bacterium]
MAEIAKKKFMGVEIPEGLTKANFYALFIGTTLGGLVTNSINGIQHSYLKDYLKVSQELFGTVSGTLMTLGEIAAIIFLFFFGVVADKIGRKSVITIGYIGATIAYLLFFHSKDIAEMLGINPLPLAYAGRFLIVATVAGVWGTYIIVTADYTDEANRAKGMGLNGIFTGFGMLLAMGVFASLPNKIGTRNTFYLTAAVSIASLIYARIALVDRFKPKEKEKGQIKKIIETLKSSPPLVMCYAARFFVMAAVITVGTFIFVWAVNAAPNLGVTPEAAQGKVGMFIGISGLVAFVGFPIFAIMCDKLGRYVTLSISLGLGGLALISFGLIDNPISWPILICMLVFFFSQAGMLLSSQTLASDIAPKRVMGTVLGGLNTTGQIGAAVFFSVDGITMDKISPQSPFIIMGVCCILMIIWVMITGTKVKKGQYKIDT